MTEKNPSWSLMGKVTRALRSRIYSPARSFAGRYRSLVRGGVVQLYVPNIQASFAMPAKSDLALRILVEGQYETELGNAILNHWKGGGSMVNIGANVGFWPVFAARHLRDLSRIHAVEPNPAAISFLKQNLRDNACDHLTEVVGACLGSAPGAVSLSVIDGMPEYSSIAGIVHSAVRQEKQRTVEVPCYVGDDLFAGVNDIRLIVIDTEGAEVAVLRGLKASILRERPTVIMECSAPLLAKFGNTVDEVQQFFTDCGYSLLSLDGCALKLSKDFNGDLVALAGAA